MKCGVPLAALISAVLVTICAADGHGGLSCPDGWDLAGSKCYKVFYGEDKNSYDRAREVCRSYRSHLVIITNHLENNFIGARVEELTSRGETYYIGLSKEKDDDCATCPDLKWSNGEAASEHEAYWSDNQPDDSNGGCVFANKNPEDYPYDRPYTWSYGSCMVKQSFVCERMAAPDDTYHCNSGEYINIIRVCDGTADCNDGSDELDCPSNCRYYQTLAPGQNEGTLAQLQYRDSWTCTWAIETDPGTNTFVRLTNFNTEFQADYVTIYAGSLSEADATPIARISGNIGTAEYRSYNNMMFIRFTSDSSVSNVGTMTGFTGTYGALRVDSGLQVSLTATEQVKSYAVTTYNFANARTFLSQRDYIIVINTQSQNQFGPMITVEVDDMQLSDEDIIMFFDGGNSLAPMLGTICNNDDDCTNNKVVYSTGKQLSILLRTGRMMADNVAFNFRYKQGCEYATTDLWGTLFTPGFPGKINYPNFVKCTWTINAAEPVALYFDSESRLEDEGNNRVVNADYLKMYDDGVMVAGSSPEGLTTADIAGQVFQTSGTVRLELDTTSIRSARGFLVRWSKACPNPNYDNTTTTVSTAQPVWHYRSMMDVTCKTGYAFQQEQTQISDMPPTFMTTVTVECGFMGMWKNYLQIPRCTPKYCGPVPTVPNAIIESATSVVYGGRAKYKCNEGSVLSSGDEIICRDDGTWSPRPTCIAATCPPGRIFTNIPNGNGVLMTGDGTSIGTVYEFSCNDGFEFDGEPYVFCQDDGSWTQNSAPSCRRLTCLLPEIENGFYVGANAAGQFINFESSATVNCNNGYRLADTGPSSVICNANRSLTELPQCVDRDECDIQGICEGQCHNTVGSFYCSCDSGYFLAQDQSRCLDINECDRNTDNCDDGCTNIPGSYTCSCSPPYVLYTQDMTSGFAIPTTAGETGLLPTDTYHIDHSCVLVSCSNPPSTIANGTLLTKREYHRYGDHVEYLCDIGFTPRRTVLTCDRNGNWIGTVPTCVAATCTEAVGFVENPPTNTAGVRTYAYGERLTMQCNVANQQFERYRFCTYDKENDDYVMQGSSYECGDVDCGQPAQAPGSTYGTVLQTTFGASFEFNCLSNNQRRGSTLAGSDSTVICLAEGYWDFGNLQCFGQSCLDPGYPAGGNIIATSFADGSTVSFSCGRAGYGLSADTTLTCRGTDFFAFGETVPTCVDQENPVIIGCPTQPIVYNRYELLSDRLPNLRVSDNTAIRSYTIEPRNANSTMYATEPLQVVYRVSDHANNEASCTVTVQIADETPPDITCPDVIYVELESELSDVVYDKLEKEDIFTVGVIDSIKTFRVDGEPERLTYLNLYQTFTYTITVTDFADNLATCKGHIVVRPRAGTPLDFPTPLNAIKECTTVLGIPQCVITCETSYTFEDAKSKTVRYINNRWEIDPIPACVLDVTSPEVTCPPSFELTDIDYFDLHKNIDFTADLQGSVIAEDLNTVGEPVFSPPTYNFTANDFYRPVTVQVFVTDIAGNTGFCNFQYTAVPPVCSETALRVPTFGRTECVRRQAVLFQPAGWDCEIICETGRILRNHGSTKSVSCNDNVPWADADIYPACIVDTVDPIITVCPASRTEKLYTGNEIRTVVFETDNNYAHAETDFSGIRSVTFSPPSLQLSASESILNRAVPILMTVVDNANNEATCTFYVLVEADDCSPLALQDPPNGERVCTPLGNSGYTCTYTCNAGYAFYGTVDTEVTTTCFFNGQGFSQIIPDCVLESDTAQKEYIAKLQYEYLPSDDTVSSVNSSCIDYYKDKVAERSSPFVADSLLDQMATRLQQNCATAFGPFASGTFSLAFFSSSTTGNILSDGVNFRRVELVYQYTISYAPDPGMDSKCTSSLNSQINEPENTFPLNLVIEGNDYCPTLKWNDVAGVIEENEYCLPPYFESPPDSNICWRCPAGTQSDGEKCTVCPVGYYKTSAGSACQRCDNGFTTRYPGAVSSSQCIALCTGGTASTTGHSPCYLCPIGTYRRSNTECLSCNPGQTTLSVGSEVCVDTPPPVTEPCSLGTQDDGNGQCELCPIGTYRSNNSLTCVECRVELTSTYFKGAISGSQCYGKCSAGYVSATGRAPCTPCPKNQYAVNETTCEECPTNYRTVTTGATLCIADADLRLKCPRGTFRNDTSGACIKCPRGTYNPTEDGSCLSCRGDESTYVLGATSQNMCYRKCEPGFFSASGLSPCTPCGIGRYSAIYGAPACTPCSVNNDKITATTTSTSSSQCINKCSLGTFSYNGYDVNGACRQCPRNHYQDQEGAKSCKECPSTLTFSGIGGLRDSSECLSGESQCINRCQNNGVCVFQDHQPVCICTQGVYYGPTCSTPVDHCASTPCYNNGVCTSSEAGFSCNCAGTGATGTRCETITKLCDTSQSSPTCDNGGHCINRLGRTECLCPEGFGGDTTCSVKTDICDTNPCSAIGTLRCVDVSGGSDLRWFCECRPGYTGETCSEDVDECASTPCINGGECVNGLNSFSCNCPTGYTGTYCQTRQDWCQSYNCRRYDTAATCVDMYSLDQPTCICNPGFAYDGSGFTQYQIRLNRAPENLDSFSPETGITTVVDCRIRCTLQTTNCGLFAFDTDNNRCYLWNRAISLSIIDYSGVNLYTKEVRYPEDDFYTLKYNLNTPSASDPRDSELLSTLRDVYGLDICGGSEPLTARCCPTDSTCLDNDGLPFGVQCTSQGLTTTNLLTDFTVQFKCSVNRVFQNNDCRQKTDYCSLDTCQNGGSCRSVFGAYVCICVNGYTGRNCQTNIDDCAVNPCNNGGTCVDNVGFATCICTPEYEGQNCNTPKNFCLNENCNGHGTCSNVAGVGYRCQCSLGYEGTDCEVEINFCSSNPCQHGGACERRVGGYTCRCVDGWQGVNCEAPVEHCDRPLTGLQCQADCYNIFNDYYCACEDNSFGVNCEDKPFPCRDYNKCQNNAVCSYNGTMSCTCPARYTGDGCQILRDYCGRVNPCENGAMCSVTDDGYRCTCPPGYNGMNCENEINECESVTCPGNGQCYDAINKYYCRCPLRFTGTNCEKVFDRNYDMFFNRPHAFAWIPYPVQVTSANYISVSLWVRYSMDGGTGVYLTQFIGDRLEEADPFMEFNDEGVRVYVQNGLDPYIQLTYDRNARVNDGNWHLVTFLYDMVNGVVNHYLDTIWHDTATSNALVMPDATFSMWVVLGCEFDNIDHMCMEGGRGFHGYLSQINWYKRELTYEGDRDSPNPENRVGEIPRIFSSPQHIYDSDVSMLILLWYEYDMESGVSIMTPSEAHGVACDVVTRSPPCSSYRTTALPTVTNCPEDMVVYSAERIVTVTYDEPVFRNLGTQNRVIKPSRQSGSTFTWGVYRNTYIGMDDNNNKAFCHFTIIVTNGRCDEPPDPFGGDQSCSTVSGRKGCMISCNQDNQNMYMIDRAHPDLFTCDLSGYWNADKPFRRFRYPSCGLIIAEPQVYIYIRVSYQIGTSACVAAKRNIITRTFEELRKLREIFVGILCQVADCTDVTVEATCSPISNNPAAQRRRKRQTGSQSTLLLEITLPSVSARTILDQESISAEEFLTYFILGAEVLDFDTVPDLTFLKEFFAIEVTEICPVGQVLRNGQCVECGPGNYFRYTDSGNRTAICDDCPLGYYQDERGTDFCKKCDDGFTTEMTGEYLSTSCKRSCPVGQYFLTAVDSCVLCEIGYYQDEVGQFRCKGCPAGYTTKDEGSTSSDFCSVSCDSGFELNSTGDCVPCLTDQYRNATETQTCQPCPPGFITSGLGSKSRDDCTITACSAGTYLDVVNNVCRPCPLNTFQPAVWQTFCFDCGDPERYRTESVGSDSPTDCLYYCPSGFEVKTDPNNRCSICPVGTYKDNTVNIQGDCETCSGNLRTEFEGSISASNCTIYKCPVGFEPNAQNTDCVECPLGYYQNVEYSKECEKCLDGFSTRQTAATSSSQCERYCPSGQEKIGGQCRPCLKGYYKDNADGLFGVCQQCNILYTTADIGSDDVSDCNIRSCPPGTKRTADDLGCEGCPLGTYQPDAFQRDCIQCANHNTSTRSVNSTSENDCETFCPSGYEKVGTTCVGCERGYTKDNAVDGVFAQCKLCPIDFITADRNSGSASLCNVGNCSAGEYLRPDRTCALCEKGTYQTEKWMTECIPCGIDKTTENIGSDEETDCILECSPGYEDIGGSCQPCRRGYFKVEYAAASCKPCPPAFTTETTGANTTDFCIIPACQVGQYLDRVTDPANLQCRPCPYDRYQDEIWQEECKPCLNNKVTFAMGADEETDCVLDCESGTQYTTDTGVGRCVFCPIGYYRNRDDRQHTQCQLCPIESLTASEGGRDVSECVIANCTEDGYYRETSTNTCEQCPLGTYLAQKWLTSCIDCPLGNSTKFPGSTSVDDCRSVCPLGQFVGANNNCELCARGTYRSDPAAETCTPCQNGLTTAGLGAIREDQCNVSPCLAGERWKDVECVKCAVGTYQPSPNSFQCVDCPYSIKYTPREGAVSDIECRSPCSAGEQFDAGTTSCIPCPRGTYQPGPFQYTCMQCPEGRLYTSQTGSQRVEDCLSYCSVSAANDCSVNATCTVSSTSSRGYICQCFANHEDIRLNGEFCIHKCDRNYCQNDGICSREATLSCSCGKWYKGNRCEERIEGPELSDKTLDIVIPVAIAAGGLILFLIILAVCCLCWRRGRPVDTPEPQYSEFNGDRVDKASIHSYHYGAPYDSRPPSRLMMLAPAQEVYYDNKLYSTKEHAAVYEA